MSGTTSLCLQQQWHNTTGDPLVGGLLYSMQAGTLNPQNAYRTGALTAGEEYPNPLVLDASARVPQMFYADGLVRLILTDRHGIAQFDYDNVPVIGSSGGSGSVDTTDTARLFSTGDMKLKYGSGAITGYVRGNGRTIGNALSGASEYFADDAIALFQYFWNTDPSLVVTPSRGASASADWLANRQIATPDFRGLVIGGLDGMGNSRSGRMAAAGGAGTTNWDVIGQALGGQEAPTITLAQMPLHKHDVSAGGNSVSGSYSGSASVSVGAVTGTTGFSYTAPAAFGAAATSGSGFGFVGAGTSNVSVPGQTASGSSSGSFSGSGSAPAITESNKGSSNAFSILQPTRLVTVYFRL